MTSPQVPSPRRLRHALAWMVVASLSFAGGGPARAQSCNDNVAGAERSWNGRVTAFLGMYPGTAVAMLTCGTLASKQVDQDQQLMTFAVCALPVCAAIGFETCRNAGLEALQLAVERMRLDEAVASCRTQ